MAKAKQKEVPCATGCGPTIGGGRKAVAVDPGIKKANLARLKRIEGQVRGVQNMVEQDRYCAEILGQIAAVQEALRCVGRELMRNHMRHCAVKALHEGGQDAQDVCDEIVEFMFKNAR